LCCAEDKSPGNKDNSSYGSGSKDEAKVKAEKDSLYYQPVFVFPKVSSHRLLG
jgi:hypothetical protein